MDVDVDVDTAVDGAVVTEAADVILLVEQLGTNIDVYLYLML